MVVDGALLFEEASSTENDGVDDPVENEGVAVDLVVVVVVVASSYVFKFTVFSSGFFLIRLVFKSLRIRSSRSSRSRLLITARRVEMIRGRVPPSPTLPPPKPRLERLLEGVLLLLLIVSVPPSSKRRFRICSDNGACIIALGRLGVVLTERYSATGYE